MVIQFCLYSPDSLQLHISLSLRLHLHRRLFPLRKSSKTSIFVTACFYFVRLPLDIYPSKIKQDLWSCDTDLYWKVSQSACVCVCSGPRCVARFDFEGEQSDELSFSEGQVIRLMENIGEEWARGEVGGHVGIFPLNFVEVLEDLPPSPPKNQTRVPLPGMNIFIQFCTTS